VNVFEMFGFFMIGSVFNMLIILMFFIILIEKIRKSMDVSIGKLSLMIESLLCKVETIINVFKKGGEDENLHEKTEEK
jgi:hypothetical protein